MVMHFPFFFTRCLTHLYFFAYAESFFSADLMLAFPPCFSADRVCAVTSVLSLFLRSVYPSVKELVNVLPFAPADKCNTWPDCFHSIGEHLSSDVIFSM